MSGVQHVVVVGGGVAGSAVAFYLSRAGVAVTLFEREGLASGASGWSAGGLNPLHGVPPTLAAFAMASYHEHVKVWPELERLSGRSFERRLVEMVMPAATDADEARLHALGAAFEAADGFSAQWLDRAALLALEPRLAAHLTGGLLTRGNGVVSSEQFTMALADAARAQGADIRSGTVTGLRHTDQTVTGVVVGAGDAAEVISCDAAVIASGPWSGTAADWLGCPVPIEPLKGEIVRVSPPGPPLACDVVTDAVSLFSRTDGQVWIGATQERRGFDLTLTTDAYDRLRAAAADLMPSLSDSAVIRQTACLRPVAPDDLPILGAAPGWSGAYLATGAGKKGILLAPAMGRAVAELIVQGETAIPLEGYGPARFLETPPS